MSKAKKKRGWIIALTALLVLMVAGGFLVYEGKKTLSQGLGSLASDGEADGDGMSIIGKYASEMKQELKDALKALKSGDLETAEEKLGSVSSKVKIVRPLVKTAITFMGRDSDTKAKLENILALVELLDTTIQELLDPAIDFMKEHPISSMKTEQGVDMKILWAYLDFGKDMMPKVETVMDLADRADLSIIDGDGSFTGKLDLVRAVLNLYHQDETIFDSAKIIFGSEGDRLYLLAGQTSAEIRACGGFPGCLGTIRITDGILEFDDFERVNNLLSTYVSAEVGITDREAYLFYDMANYNRDAEYCPDFERVAPIFALAYEEKMGEHINGVLSLTPVVIQRMLAVLEQEIVLEDGTVLTGNNAGMVLQHDLYFKYFGNSYQADARDVTEELFAEAAEKALDMVLSHLSPSDLLRYMYMARGCFGERTLMIWSEDAPVQAMLRRLDWNGGLNTDPWDPKLGVYFNGYIAAKIGMFLTRETVIGPGTANEDGTVSYPVTVTLGNCMTPEEYEEALSRGASYITSYMGSTIVGAAYFFAPAGGRVEGFETSDGSYIDLTEYHDLALGFMPTVSIPLGGQITITYVATTAPGVTAVPGLSQTPTVMNNR